MGPERAHVHTVGADAVRDVGMAYGVKGWPERTAIYTWDVAIDDSTTRGSYRPKMYVYLALVPVEPEYWHIAHVHAGAITELE